ncbi:hypothetical protein MA16_Dca028781 [Dendrobium catenatum]|uniref:Uncharacterized protein n=1 Tax=Dendrobium catenatum TaxID=906689 RepID=A0A2I0V6G9_9ASPA|nr:hypothetical protein MA16_Dca028781 [Dendrobium catenatum]
MSKVERPRGVEEATQGRKFPSQQQTPVSLPIKMSVFRSDKKEVVEGASSDSTQEPRGDELSSLRPIKLP